MGYIRRQSKHLTLVGAAVMREKATLHGKTARNIYLTNPGTATAAYQVLSAGDRREPGLSLLNDIFS